MRRSRPFSRVLIAILGTVIVLGLVAYFFNTRSRVDETQASQTAPDTPAATPDQPAEAPRADDRPPLPADALVTSTPAALQPGTVIATTTPPSATPAPTATVTPVAAPAPAPRPKAPAVPVDRAIAEGKAKIEAGELLAGREILNAALISGQLNAEDRQIAKTLIAQANQTLLLSSKFFPDDPWQEAYTVQSGDLMVRIANRYFIPYELISRINNNVAPNRIRPGQKLKVLKGPMHAVVSKSRFTLDLYLGAPGGEGSLYVCSFPVGLGADDSTPTGLWVVPKGAKARNPVYYSPRGEGIIAADDPKNPLGEHWIAIEGVEGDAVGKTSYGIHGTIEPETIGKQASMGCIRLRNEDIAQVFEMLYEVKSTVRIVE